MSFQGKNKAITFSFDDGVVQDIRAVEILNRYGLKGTFNLNSSYLGLPGISERNGNKIENSKVKACDIKNIYAGHEIAVHTLTHPNLLDIDDDNVAYQVEQDRIVLSNLAGYDVVGMAYPYGTVDDRVADIIKNRTGVRYSRTVKSVGFFEKQEDLYKLNPSIHFGAEELFSLGEKFLSLKPEKPTVFYIWGHTYELDYLISWEKFEEFCKMISGKDDIFYGTNREILL